MAKGDALMDQGSKEMNKSGFSTFFSSRETKYENASELFEKAGNSFKQAKAWDRAGAAFREAASCYQQIKSNSDAAGKLKEAGDCYKKSPNDALQCVEVWREACAIFLDIGRWNQCGNLAKAIAEMYEGAHQNGLATTCEDPAQEAIDSYQQAAEYYGSESPPREQAANSCLEKVAALSAVPTVEGGYGRAAGIFEDIGEHTSNKKNDAGDDEGVAAV